MPQTHHLKTWPEHFQAVALGIKRAELRKDDRGFSVGDTLVLQEWDRNIWMSVLGSGVEAADAVDAAYTGAEIRARVTHTLHGPGFGLEAGYVMMSLSLDEVRP
jgi:hypothetical protein